MFTFIVEYTEQIKGLLPNLQGGLEELPKAANRGVFWIRKKKSGPVRCDIRFSHETVWKPETHMELDEALKGWFMSVGAFSFIS